MISLLLPILLEYSFTASFSAVPSNPKKLLISSSALCSKHVQSEFSGCTLYSQTSLMIILKEKCEIWKWIGIWFWFCPAIPTVLPNFYDQVYHLLRIRRILVKPSLILTSDAMKIKVNTALYHYLLCLLWYSLYQTLSLPFTKNT